MKKIQWTLLSTVCFATLVICSCKKNDEAEPVVVAPVKDDAVYIVNEGSFGSGNGTIDYYSAKADSIANDIFGYVNAIPLGDVVQSMAVYNGRGYICVNNSQKLQVVNLADFSDFGSSGGFQGPRYFLGISNARGYVSDWFSDHVKVVDLTTLAVIDSIKTGSGPEQMVMVNQTVYVANVGGYGNDSTVTVINTLTNSVITTIQTGINPNSLQVDTNGNIWVLCGGTIGPDFIGGTGDDRAGSLVRINSLNNTIDKTFAMTSAEHPIKLAIDGSKSILYYLNGNDNYQGTVHKMNINDAVLPSTALVNKKFYGLGIGPISGDIYGGFTPDFTQAGTMFRYNSNGGSISSKTTGVAPNGFVFY